MKVNKVLLVLAIGSVVTLSGCAESQTMGSAVGKGAMSLVDSFTTGIQKGIDKSFSGTANSATNRVTNTPSNTSRTLPSDDMVYLFGDMEGGCLGKGMSFQTFDQSALSLEDSIKGVSNSYSYYVKPRSQWLPAYRDIMKDVQIYEGNEYTEYHMIFKDGVNYRGQPLEKYIFMFRPESSGVGEVLKFSPTANIATIWPNFRSYKMDYWGEMIDMGATYSPQNKTITCLID